MKIFRDPIHNVIDLDTGDKTVNNLLINLIDSKEFQRLRFIKQLGFSYLAYPSATHSRFEHSLGAAFLAKRFIDKLISLEEEVLVFHKNSEHINELNNFFERIKTTRNLTIVAALLHDIGHGPLSHVIEEVLDINHEKWAQEIILGETEINALLCKHDDSWPQMVCNILSGKQGRLLPSSKIIAGQLDIDKIDYLLRDSHMTGSKYGEFDVEWLLNVLMVGIVDGRVEIGLNFGKGLSIAEDFVMARIYMFRNVYLHKTNLIAQKMLELLIKRIKELPREMTAQFFPNKSLSGIFFSQNKEAAQLLGDYLAISDIDLFYFLKLLQKSEDEVLSRLSSGILNRRLFKEINFEHWHNMLAFIADKIGKNIGEYFVVELEAEAKKDKTVYRPGIDELFLFAKNGMGYELLEKSSIIPLKVHDSAVFHSVRYVDYGVYNQYHR